MKGLAEHYALSQEMRDFLAAANPWALNAIAERLLEAAKRELWENPAPETLDALRGVLLESEAVLEAQGERKRGRSFMKPAVYPFAAIVGQSEMKLALLLAAVDWRLGVLLRGEKGAGKTTAARGLAALLPEPAPFINLPIGATEDRLLGGLHLERALKGEPVLKPGLLSEAHGGVLYVDEINLLPAHLGDALLDTAASGVNVVEREGLSASHAAEFVLLGSMNPEEGRLRPQLLDRFALSVDITASLDPGERQTVVERRIAFDRDASRFANEWSAGSTASA